MLTLIVVKSPAPDYPAGIAFKIQGSWTVTLGRGSKADIRLNFRKLSREHLQFIPTSQGWCIRELGSKNGSKLNGETIKAIEPLSVSDRIRAGKFLFDVAEVSAPQEGRKQIQVVSKDDEEVPEVMPQKFSSAEEDDLIAEFEDILG